VKVVGIAGSPRRGGNTDMLLAELLKGAASMGVEVKTIMLRDMKFVTCQHCDACLKAGVCKYKDDMQSIYTDFEEADVIVLASPIQFTGVTSDMKALIDRFQSRWVKKYLLKIPPLGDRKLRKGFFISVGGRKVPDLFEPALVMIKTFFRILDITYAGDLLVAAVDEKGAITKHPDALRRAFEAGQKLVEPA
jgi:multimeric flavodoxin WrbA